MKTMPGLPDQQRRRVPPKVREAIRLLVEGDCKTITAAAKKVSLSRERLSRALGEAHVSAWMIERIQRHVAVGGARGAARMVKLVDAARSERTQFESARFLLGVAGVKVASDANNNVSLNVAVGYVIDLRPRNSPAQPGDIIVAGATPAALPAAAAEE